MGALGGAAAGNVGLTWMLFLRTSSRSLVIAVAALMLGCGARTGLGDFDEGRGGAGNGGSAGSVGGGPQGGSVPCVDGELSPCGSDVGACISGSRECLDGALGPCVGDVGPKAESCNGIDDNCDGAVDEGFGLGQACDGPDSDLCADDKVVCGGCSSGDDDLEVCNGVDDNCNGIVDSDCEAGSCSPKLVVVDIVKSMESCFVDSVQPGSEGEIDYPCGGGPVSAMFGPILFTGAVSGGEVSLDATTTFDWSDGCKWASVQTITGTIESGSLQYSYSEMPIQGTGCQPPCTAKGTIAVAWN